MNFTESNFEQVINSNVPVLVDFWAPWCGPCKAIAPVIEELAKEFAGKAKVGKVNVDETPGLATKYQIRSIPSLLIFKNGSVVDRIVGAGSKQHIVTKLESFI